MDTAEHKDGIFLSKVFGDNVESVNERNVERNPTTEPNLMHVVEDSNNFFKISLLNLNENKEHDKVSYLLPSEPTKKIKVYVQFPVLLRQKSWVKKVDMRMIKTSSGEEYKSVDFFPKSYEFDEKGGLKGSIKWSKSLVLPEMFHLSLYFEGEEMERARSWPVQKTLQFTNVPLQKRVTKIVVKSKDVDNTHAFLGTNETFCMVEITLAGNHDDILIKNLRFRFEEKVGEEKKENNIVIESKVIEKSGRDTVLFFLDFKKTNPVEYLKNPFHIVLYHGEITKENKVGTSDKLCEFINYSLISKVNDLSIDNAIGHRKDHVNIESLNRLGEMQLQGVLRSYRLKEDFFGKTILHLFIKMGMKKMCIECLNLGFEVNWKDKFGNNYLHHCYYLNKTDLIEVFRKNKIEKDCKNMFGLTPKQMRVFKKLNSKEKIENKNLLVPIERLVKRYLDGKNKNKTVPEKKTKEEKMSDDILGLIENQHKMKLIGINIEYKSLQRFLIFFLQNYFDLCHAIKKKYGEKHVRYFARICQVEWGTIFEFDKKQLEDKKKEEKKFIILQDVEQEKLEVDTKNVISLVPTTAESIISAKKFIPKKKYTVPPLDKSHPLNQGGSSLSYMRNNRSKFMSNRNTLKISTSSPNSIGSYRTNSRGGGSRGGGTRGGAFTRGFNRSPKSFRTTSPLNFTTSSSPNGSVYTSGAFYPGKSETGKSKNVTVKQPSPFTTSNNYFQRKEYLDEYNELTDREKKLARMFQKGIEHHFVSVELSISLLKKRILEIEDNLEKQKAFNGQTSSYIQTLDYQLNNLSRVKTNAMLEESVKDLNMRLGENLHLSICYPFKQYFKLTFEIDIRVESFRLCKTNHGKKFKKIKTVSSSKKYRRLLQGLDETHSGFKTWTGYKKYVQIFSFNTDALNYDILGLDNDGEIVALVKMSSNILQPINWNILSYEKLSVEQLAMVKKMCQLERQLSYLADIDKLKFVGLFIIGKFFDIKMKDFFYHNKGTFPNLEKVYKEDKFFVGKFSHLFKTDQL